MDSGKQKYLASFTTEELKKELDIFLTMDSNGGMMANVIIEELAKREEPAQEGK